MNKTIKRIISMVLCFVMVLGFVPANVFAATGDVIDAAIFCSDVHGNPSVVSSVFGAIKSTDSAFSPSTASFVGDTDGSTSTVTEKAQSVYSNVKCYYAYGSHDSGYVDDVTGVLYNGTNYAIYAISQSDMENYSKAQSAAANFASDLADVAATKPLFIISHMPLHARRADNDGAGLWCDAINAQAGSRDIVFFWAHNHTGENSTDTNAYYLAKGSSITVEDDSSDNGESSATASKTLKFTYMNAGYIGKSAGRGGVVTTVKIYSDAMVFQDYNSSGAYTGSYAHNVEVAREFAAKEVTLSSIALSGKTEYYVGDELKLTVTATYSDGTTADVTAEATLSGYDKAAAGTQTVTATYGEETATVNVTVTAVEINTIAVTTLPTKLTYITGEELDTTGMVVTATYNNGTTAEVTGWYTSAVDMATVGEKTVTVNYAVDGITYKTTFTITVEEGLPENVYLTRIEVTKTPDKTEYLLSEELKLDGMVVTATFSDGSSRAIEYKPFSTSSYYGGYELDNFSMYVEKAHEVKVTYTLGEVTCTTATTINVWNEDFTDETTGVKVYVTGDYGVTSAAVKVLESETVAEDISSVISGTNYVAYDISLVFDEGYATTNATKTVTLPIPEGVNNPVVYYVSEDGATVTNMNAVKDGNGNVTFETTHFSTYVVGEDVEDPSNEVTIGSSGVTKEVYVLTNSLTANGEYLIVNVNAAGSGYALGHSGTSVASDSVTVLSDGTNIYIESTDVDSTSVWTAATYSSGFNLTNGGYYLLASGSTSAISFNTSATSGRYWNYSGDDLGCYGGNSTHYIYYSNGFVSAKNSGSEEVYIYEKKTIDTSSEVTYTMRAEDLKQVVDTTNSATLTANLSYCLQGNGADLTTLPSGGSYSFTEMSDVNDIIKSIADDGTVTFSGTTGTATVKVAYTWTADDSSTYTVYKYITVEASEPYYSLDLHKANTSYVQATAYAEGTTYFIQNEDGTYEKVSITAFEDDVTYYTLSYTLGDEITETVSLKGVQEGDRYGVWAVVKYFDGTTETGEDLGAVGDDIVWSSSDTSIATVDPNTGIITFTGEEGSVDITATYQNGNKPADTISISVTESLYVVPADKTKDFPEYPNEGAIRFDKTAEAVGNFSETGIAQVELSMTGVPYTTGSEIDVVLMLDMTGSMTTESMAAAEAAALAFAKQIVLNTDGTYNKNRISIQVFNKNGVTELWPMSAVTEDTYNSLVTAIESASTKQATGGTPYSTALSGCKDILDAAKKDGVGKNRQQFCVFVSDGTPTSYTDVDGGSDTTKKEYYSSQMQEDGVTVYGVYTSAAAGSSGSGGSSVNDTAEGKAIMQNVASSDDKVYTIDDYTDTSALTGVFTSIAKEILQAATDVVVEDKINDSYTMIFDIPTGTKDITGVTNDFSIEFVKYELTPVYEQVNITAFASGVKYYTKGTDGTYTQATSYTSDTTYYIVSDYTRSTSTSVTKLYLKKTDGVLSAASDSTGTAYAAPVFEAKVIGEKGTKLYWTTDDSYASEAAVTYTNSDDTYYFIPYGVDVNEDGTVPENWYNMTSGAYAYGTVDSTNMSDDLVIATPYFVYNASTRMIYWTVEKLDTNEYVLRYFLYLDNSATEVGEDKEVDPGSYLTNDYAYITYTNYKGNDCRQEFPKPQLTWSGAQVSYVFYLVNAAGQPINKSGQVVDFANATFVTDVYTENTVWNKGEDGTITADSQLSIDWLATKLLPSDYKVYDEAASYKLHVFGDHTGETIFDYFIIGGNDAATISTSLNTRLGLETTEDNVSLTTTKVYNTKAGTKITGYGTYTSKATDQYDNETVLTNIDFYNTTVAFAVVWQPALAPDAVVVDYGLDVLIDVCLNDLMQDNTISGIGLSREAYGAIVENVGISTTSVLGTADLEKDGNTISIENEHQIRFSQNDMTFKESVTFYYESEVKYYEASEQKTGYLHSSVTVIPATTIYYEDDFLTLSSYSKEDDNWVKDEKSAWTTEGTLVNDTQDQDRPGTTQITGVVDANNNYGYDSAYENMATHSMGSAAMITVDANTRGEATFTFWGTGFDVISTTSNTSGTITVKVTDAAGNVVENTVVDTYYGYTRNEAGEWVITNETANALYQVPVIKIFGLPYGQYTVKITAGYNDFFNHTAAESSYDLYLDAIRIYDPTGDQNEVANDAYIADGEAYPEYFEVRDQIISKDTYDSLNDETVSGIVFIDGAVNGPSIEDYKSYGPNNEVYLTNGQAIAFDLNGTYTVPTGMELAKIQLAVKTTGSEGHVEVYGVKNGTKVPCLDETISTATDMYYDITGLEGMTVVIKSTGAAIVSITNVKVTYQPATTDALATTSVEETEAPMLFSISRASADAALVTLCAEKPAEPTEPETEPTEPETEPTEPETEPTEPETEPTEPETEPTEPETTEPEVTEPEEDNSDDVIKETVAKAIRKIVKKLFGWLFG